MRTFPNAGPAEIFRSVEKDDWYKQRLQGDISDALLNITGVRLWSKWKELSNLLSEFLYYACTTISKCQTLGEEATGIVQTDGGKLQLPPMWRVLLMITLDSFGQPLLTFLLGRVEEELSKDSDVATQLNISNPSREGLLRLIGGIRSILPYVQKIHTAIFFINSDFYHIGKRLTSVQYVVLRYWMKNRSTAYGFKTVGVLSLVQVLLNIVVSIASLVLKNKVKSSDDERPTTSNMYVDPVQKCSLCLDTRYKTSTTACGHLFCWSCIMEWLQTKQECPLCREAVHPSRIILLQNYDMKSRSEHQEYHNNIFKHK